MKSALPKHYPTLAGILYLLIIVFGLIAQIFVRDNLVDYGDAGITANRIMGSEFLFRFGFVSELMMLACDVAVTMILYVMLRSVSAGLAMLSTFFRLVSISILGLTALSHYAALQILGDAGYLKVFETGQLQALALLSIKLHGSGYNISLFFFGFHLFFLGILIAKSGWFPRILGFLLQVGGPCYIVNSLVWFLFPALVSVIYPAILLPCFGGELFLSLWLLISGRKIATALRPGLPSTGS